MRSCWAPRLPYSFQIGSPQRSGISDIGGHRVARVPLLYHAPVDHDIGHDGQVRTGRDDVVPDRERHDVRVDRLGLHDRPGPGDNGPALVREIGAEEDVLPDGIQRYAVAPVDLRHLRVTGPEDAELRHPLSIQDGRCDDVLHRRGRGHLPLPADAEPRRDAHVRGGVVSRLYRRPLDGRIETGVAADGRPVARHRVRGRAYCRDIKHGALPR